MNTNSLNTLHIQNATNAQQNQENIHWFSIKVYFFHLFHYSLLLAKKIAPKHYFETSYLPAVPLKLRNYRHSWNLSIPMTLTQQSRRSSTLFRFLLLGSETTNVLAIPIDLHQPSFLYRINLNALFVKAFIFYNFSILYIFCQQIFHIYFFH